MPVCLRSAGKHPWTGLKTTGCQGLSAFSLIDLPGSVSISKVTSLLKMFAGALARRKEGERASTALGPSLDTSWIFYPTCLCPAGQKSIMQSCLAAREAEQWRLSVLGIWLPTWEDQGTVDTGGVSATGPHSLGREGVGPSQLLNSNNSNSLPSLKLRFFLILPYLPDVLLSEVVVTHGQLQFGSRQSSF